MTSNTAPCPPRKEFSRLLDATRVRLRRARLRAGLPVALERALWTLAAVTGGILLVSTIARIRGLTPMSGGAIYWLLLVVAAVIPTVVVLASRYWATPSLFEAAQRLDLGAGTHNRVAVGWELCDCKNHNVFVRAAVLDGLHELRRIRGEHPFPDPVLPRWRGSAAALLLIALFMIGSAMFAPASAPVLTSARPAGTDAARDSSLRPNEAAKRRGRRSTETTANPPRQSPQTHTGDDATRPPGQQANRQSARASGATVSGSAAGRRATSASARAATESSTALAQSRSPREERDRKSQTAAEARERPAHRSGNPKSAKSSTTAGGGSHGGAASPVHHDWAQRSRTAAGEDDEGDDEDAELEDESTANKQRGGIQPSLKDRQEAPSRELGVSGAQGKPGTGRGGPTPPKKARGTTSMVLGVPVPDFVKGRLGPGTTRVTQQRAKPIAYPHQRSAVKQPPPGSPAASNCRPPAIAPEYRSLVRDYLVALHAANGELSSMNAPSPAGDAGQLNHRGTHDE